VALPDTVGSDATARLQPAEPAVLADTAVNPRWSARAEVRPGGGAVRRAVPPEWDEPAEDPYGGRSWFTPVIVGTVALLLLAMLVIGLVLIYRALHNEATPQPVTSASSAAPSTSPSVPRTTAAAPTSTPPSPTPAPKVTVPADVVGKSEAAARAELEALGLVVQVRSQPSGSADPGTVLATEPGPNSAVDPGSTVVLVVAVAPPPRRPTTPAPKPTPTGTG
jgi:hypothetical protein